MIHAQLFQCPTSLGGFWSLKSKDMHSWSPPNNLQQQYEKICKIIIFMAQSVPDKPIFQPTGRSHKRAMFLSIFQSGHGGIQLCMCEGNCGDSVMLGGARDGAAVKRVLYEQQMPAERTGAAMNKQPYCAYSEDSRMNSKYKSVYGFHMNSHCVYLIERRSVMSYYHSSTISG